MSGKILLESEDVNHPISQTERMVKRMEMDVVRVRNPRGQEAVLCV
jgi:hypothetical protein